MKLRTHKRDRFANWKRKNGLVAQPVQELEKVLPSNSRGSRVLPTQITPPMMQKEAKTTPKTPTMRLMLAIPAGEQNATRESGSRETRPKWEEENRRLKLSVLQKGREVERLKKENATLRARLEELEKRK